MPQGTVVLYTKYEMCYQQAYDITEKNVAHSLLRYSPAAASALTHLHWQRLQKTFFPPQKIPSPLLVLISATLDSSAKFFLKTTAPILCPSVLPLTCCTYFCLTKGGF